MVTVTGVSARERLTTAMAELMWERGYAATSPRDVLERAGVGQGSMYHHFGSKKALAVETLTTVTRRLAEDSTALLDTDLTPLERLKRHLSRPRPGTRGCRVGRMTQDPQVVGDPELHAVVAGAFATMLERWERTIAEAIEVGELPASIDPADLAHSLSAVIQGGYVLARARGSQEPMDAAIRGAVALLDAAAAGADH